MEREQRQKTEEANKDLNKLKRDGASKNVRYTERKSGNGTSKEERQRDQ